MLNKNEIQRWLAARKKPQALICDIDETLCTQFDQAIPKAIEVIRSFSPPLILHYVTARPTSSERATRAFLERHSLPFAHQLHLCPSWQSTLQHKTKTFTALAEVHQIIMSIGDADEDEQASLYANVPFFRISLDDPHESWQRLEKRLSESTQQ